MHDQTYNQATVWKRCLQLHRDLSRSVRRLWVDAEERAQAESKAKIRFIGCAVDGGPLDYAGRIYCVEGQECLVRLFAYKEPTGRAHIVVRSDGYQRILIRQDNDIAHMKLDPRLDERIKTALRSYIARSYRMATGDDVVLLLG